MIILNIITCMKYYYYSIQQEYSNLLLMAIIYWVTRFKRTSVEVAKIIRSVTFWVSDWPTVTFHNVRLVLGPETLRECFYDHISLVWILFFRRTQVNWQYQKLAHTFSYKVLIRTLWIDQSSFEASQRCKNSLFHFNPAQS